MVLIRRYILMSKNSGLCTHKLNKSKNHIYIKFVSAMRIYQCVNFFPWIASTNQSAWFWITLIRLVFHTSKKNSVYLYWSRYTIMNKWMKFNKEMKRSISNLKLKITLLLYTMYNKLQTSSSACKINSAFM